jgi:hypothetical protein
MQNSPGVTIVNVKVFDTSEEPWFLSNALLSATISAITEEHNLYKAQKVNYFFSSLT